MSTADVRGSFHPSSVAGAVGIVAKCTFKQSTSITRISDSLFQAENLKTNLLKRVGDRFKLDEEKSGIFMCLYGGLCCSHIDNILVTFAAVLLTPVVAQNVFRLSLDDFVSAANEVRSQNGAMDDIELLHAAAATLAEAGAGENVEFNASVVLRRRLAKALKHIANVMRRINVVDERRGVNVVYPNVNTCANAQPAEQASKKRRMHLLMGGAARDAMRGGDDRFTAHPVGLVRELVTYVCGSCKTADITSNDYCFVRDLWNINLQVSHRT